MRAHIRSKAAWFLLLFSANICGLGLVSAAQRPENGQFVPHELLIKFKPGVPEFVREEIHRGVGARVVGRFRGDEQLHHIRLPEGEDLDAALAYYQTRADVEYAQKNLIYHITETVPDDPMFSQQWAWKNTVTPGADVGATFAWDKARGRSTVIVASIDTGVDYMHPDLAANMWINPGEAGLNCFNGIDDDGDDYVDDCRGWNFWSNTNDPMDDNGHGTHTSGIIGALTNNSTGVAGANWAVQIMPLKFTNANGDGTTALAVQALDYAVAHGATISNNSWGTTGFDPALLDAIKRAEAAGHLFVTSAGNGNPNGSDNDATPNYPCDFSKADPVSNPKPPQNIICVAATDSFDNLVGFSNYGLTTVQLGAPGVNILSTLPHAIYGSASGTSMSSPIVAGAAALLKGCKANLHSFMIKRILLTTARQTPALAGKTVTGGIVNYQAAVNDSRVGDCEPPPGKGQLTSPHGGPK
ncbi:MAG: S8 family serine peptidase [Acidobacteriia bacterium]|nr:S8 family serine peptidase [Terriglobia bacterium]